MAGCFDRFNGSRVSVRGRSGGLDKIDCEQEREEQVHECVQMTGDQTEILSFALNGKAGYF